ncbi:MAG: sugar ABC transporter substrate-binding protein [Planctomycetota bacterium]|nr:MAG: sugar ABC transporter substrate-binding protein [Planctomycetota bacterium]
MAETTRRRWAVWLVLCVLVGLAGCGGGRARDDGSGAGAASAGGDKPTVAFVTNGIADFWVIAEKGARDAAAEFDVNLEVRMPPNGIADQKRMVQDLLAQGVDGIAISPIDPANQGDLLEEIARHTILITHDSDAPNSPRLCYVGMDNYKAGRMCGELVKQGLPDGGSVMIFVGRLGQENAKLRRQGVIDELLDRSHDPSRFDPVDAALKGEKYTILGTKTDGFDYAQAKALAQDALAKYPDLGCMVGLFEYNPPNILEAVREAGKLGQVKVVGFDENPATLQGIIDGHVVGTVVQNPYRYGYESVRILAALARGDKSVLPPGGFLDIPARKITRENVEEFWAELKRLLGKTPDQGEIEAGKAGESGSE